MADDGRTLALAGLRSGYGRHEVVRGVDLEIPAGQFVCLLGPNGAGKSTLIKTIFGMAKVFAGSIAWDGRELAGARTREVLAGGIAYVPQGRCNFPLMTVRENLEMAVDFRRHEDVEADIERVYELFDVLRRRHRQLASTLSGGEQQMLELGMALLRRPQVLLIDEPSMGLAPEAITWVFDEIQRIHRGGATVVLVEQNTKKAMAVAERAVVLRLGRIIWSGPTSAIDHDELGELFLTGGLAEAERSAAGKGLVR